MKKYGSFLDVDFEVFAYQEHEEENNFIYADLQTIKAPSNLQFMGAELRTLNLKLRFHREFCDVADSYKKIISAAKKGLPGKLIIGTIVYGDFVIEKVSSKTEMVDTKGDAVIMDLEIAFKEFIDKELKTRKIKTDTSDNKAPAVKKEQTTNIYKGEIRR